MLQPQTTANWSINGARESRVLRHKLDSTPKSSKQRSPAPWRCDLNNNGKDAVGIRFHPLLAAGAGNLRESSRLADRQMVIVGKRATETRLEVIQSPVGVVICVTYSYLSQTGRPQRCGSDDGGIKGQALFWLSLSWWVAHERGRVHHVWWFGTSYWFQR